MLPEPKRNKDIDSLVPYVRDRVKTIMVRMVDRGYGPIIFEAKRSYARQLWLWGFGRSFMIGKPYKTWTLKSKHITGKAVDIISQSKLWNHPAFFKALHEEAAKVGMHGIPAKEMCHIEWG